MLKKVLGVVEKQFFLQLKALNRSSTFHFLWQDEHEEQHVGKLDEELLEQEWRELDALLQRGLKQEDELSSGFLKEERSEGQEQYEREQRAEGQQHEDPWFLHVKSEKWHSK